MKRDAPNCQRESCSPPARQTARGPEAGEDATRDQARASLHGAVGNQALQELHETGRLRAKSAVNDPDDRGERQAERVADAVLAESIAEAPGEEQRLPSPGRSSAAASVEGQGIRSLRGGGRPLPERTRSRFESRFGYDFGGVRVHTGRAADEATRALDARAFTVGRDVFFATGEYRPESRSGEQLLAHELTHVVQQAGRRAVIQRQAPPSSPPEPEPLVSISLQSDGERLSLTLGGPKLPIGARPGVGLRFDDGIEVAFGTATNTYTLEEAKRLIAPPEPTCADLRAPDGEYKSREVFEVEQEMAREDEKLAVPDEQRYGLIVSACKLDELSLLPATFWQGSVGTSGRSRQSGQPETSSEGSRD